MGGSVRAKRRLKNVAAMRAKLVVHESMRLQRIVDKMNAHLATQDTNVMDLNVPPEMQALTKAKDVVVDQQQDDEEDTNESMETNDTTTTKKKKVPKKKQHIKKKKSSRKPAHKRRPKVV
ncbi:hypothetical protein SAMD00019534_101810 [Acytostelium subglobosum LB1]|uniref:hypothetical protein n=1 Tax=Acytostelium subglobosum LB1 TaxID=1410327 RepID=UPI000644AF4A|nr:hypothetical protein SAMD00019534_101810 [Acytostelium subglobosum LB1]GAM27006.1 hypothetical protein SAMD00019534_101810 [Acytostelium subglobosum LB1]|eukprot:XP_012749886.1 hypothetical protein SAMD00019534_101810 [Acytostelium subglobosum LB1]